MQNYFGSDLKRNCSKSIPKVAYSSYLFIKKIKNLTSVVWVHGKLCKWGKNEEFSLLFSLKFLVQKIFNFQRGEKCFFSLPTSHECFFTTIGSLSILLVYYKYPRNIFSQKSA